MPVNNFPLIENARAKINLTLHVGPPTRDGYHPLKSLVAFAGIGDVVELTKSKTGSSCLTIDGPFSAGLETDESNLILKTASYLSEETYEFGLTKNLPIASGIGGGSADAAATARLIARTSGQDITRSLVDLGADIPVCVKSQTCLMEGRGERLTLLPGRGIITAVLINPGIAVSTAAVFKSYDKTGPTEQTLNVDYPLSSPLLDIALAGRNDLQDTAISIAPEIALVLEQLSLQDGCQLARMSGSGATCFGLFQTAAEVAQACEDISARHPDWWCVPTVLGDPV